MPTPVRVLHQQRIELLLTDGGQALYDAKRNLTREMCPQALQAVQRADNFGQRALEHTKDARSAKHRNALTRFNKEVAALKRRITARCVRTTRWPKSHYGSGA